MDNWEFIIIGAGIAGMSAAQEIRRSAPQKTILVISREAELPYKRTTLSKKFHLLKSVEEIQLQDEKFFEDRAIDLMPDTTVTAIDANHKFLVIDDGTKLHFEQLLLANGAFPVFPGNLRHHSSGDCFTFRTWSDAVELRRALPHSNHVLIAGMGILGIELSEQLRLLDKKVTLMGTGPQLMHHQLTARAAEIVENSLLENGVELRYQEEILSFATQNGKSSISTVHGQSEYDLLIFCTGVQPDIELARHSGILCRKGILVDKYLESSSPGIWAAGDSAEHPDGSVSGLWHAAEAQGIVAGRNLLGIRETWQNPGFRMKSEVFGNYVFSMIGPSDLNDTPFLEFEKDNRYLAVFLRDKKVRGIVMVNHKDQVPQYQEAVRQAWTLEQTLTVFES